MNAMSQPLIDKIIGFMREHEGELISYARMGHVLNCGVASVKVYVSFIRANKYVPEGYVITNVRNKGYVLHPPKKPVKAKDYVGDDGTTEDGRAWEPKHVGDPLLDALTKHHADGHGCYPGYRGPDEART